MIGTASSCPTTVQYGSLGFRSVRSHFSKGKRHHKGELIGIAQKARIFQNHAQRPRETQTYTRSETARDTR